MPEERKEINKRFRGFLQGIALLGFFLGSQAWAQPISTDQTILDIIDPNALNSSLSFDKRYPKIEGSPYLYADWVKGEVKSPGGKVWKDMELNYDLYTQELLARYEDKIVLLSPKATKSFSFVDPQRGSLNFEQNPLLGSKGYYQAVHQGTYSLWKQLTVRLKKLENNSGGYGQGGNAKEVQRFERSDTWFLIRPGSKKPESFKPTKKELYRLFPENSAELKKFIKSHRISLKEDQDWVQVMQFLKGN